MRRPAKISCTHHPVRRGFLLVEILCSSFIAGIIIAACLTLLTLFVSTKRREEVRLLSSQERLQKACYLRRVIMSIKGGKNSFFVVEDGPEGSKRLIFLMNHGIDSSPNDSSDMIAMLYVDREKGLMLVHRPPKSRKEFGFEEEKAYSVWPGAKEVRWRFFSRNELVQDSPQDSNEWKDSWPKEEKNPPLAIKAVVIENADSNEASGIEITGIVLSQLKDATIRPR